MSRYILDSYAVLAFLEDEPGAEKVEYVMQQALQGKAEAYMSIINWGEVYYITLREQGRDAAGNVIEFLNKIPLRLMDATQSLTETAAGFKGRFRIAYADCFAAALALQHDAAVLTGDPEFRQLEGEIKISWLS